MKIKSLSYKQVGFPTFGPSQKKQGIQESHTLFDLSSHARAKEAIGFGLKMRDKGFHVFVVGEDRSGRMTGTLSYLNQHIKNMPIPPDLVYLNNFAEPHRPSPHKLPNGMGSILKEKTKDLIQNVHILLNKMLTNSHYVKQIDGLNSSLESQVDQQLAEVKAFAHEKGYEITQIPEGFNVEPKEGTDIESNSTITDLQEIREKLNQLALSSHLANQKINKKAEELKRSTAQKSIQPLIQKFQEEFSPYLEEWIETLKIDLLKHIDDFMQQAESGGKVPPNLEEWYSVNLFVDHGHSAHPNIVLEAHPTYESLFGSIKYRTNTGGAVETNFTMIRPGAFHLANGGILVLRAEALAQDPELWEFIKAALRDQIIRIEEPAKERGMPLLNAPEPQGIPLDVQVFLVGSPAWYYTFFFNDPDFRSYFKIKADIDPDLPATPKNVDIYRQLIQENAARLTGLKIAEDAVDYLIGYSARWVGHRERLSARFELVGDILIEAAVLSGNSKVISKAAMEQVVQLRRLRNAGLEDRTHEYISSGQVLIDTEGSVIGQVNGLSVLGTGDHTYGMPSRISARSYVGEEGVMNIERLTEMSGPIQQKGTLILEGFLNALFGQRFPLSYSCSLTFEQNYADIEGDSASMAELIAIVSSLSGVPIRQDIAITGSMNQFGLAQSVGGVHYKIEGFHRVCKEKGLSGTQGVIVPHSNQLHLTLRETVVDDMRQKQFSIWPVRSVFEAIELLTGQECGLRLQDGVPVQTEYLSHNFTAGSVFHAILKRLEQYHKAVKSTNR